MTEPNPPVAARTVLVPPERLERWLAGFAERHGPAGCEVSADSVVVHGADGARAACAVPFPPLIGENQDAPYGGLVRHAATERRVGVLLVRLGGFAAGIFEGERLTTSKVGSRHVQGRTAAGGQSQQRFARRRQGQARVAYGAAADTAAAILLPAARELAGLVLGGDRRACGLVLDDPRLAPLRPLVTGALLDVPDPRRRVLEATPARFRAVAIHVTEPAGPSTG
jgi:hypothetical protein